ICGDAAVYFRTHDGVDCGKAIYDLLTDDTLLQEKIERSKVRASHFSWKEYSMSLSTIFNDAVRSRQDSADTDPETELEIGDRFTMLAPPCGDNGMEPTGSQPSES